MGETVEVVASPSAVQERSSESEPLGDDAQVYEYTHADGHVERAETREAARAMCPVLGKMALTQANLLLEVAAIGQRKMQEEKEEALPEVEELQPQEAQQSKEQPAQAIEKIAEDTKASTKPDHLNTQQSKLAGFTAVELTVKVEPVQPSLSVDSTEKQVAETIPQSNAEQADGKAETMSGNDHLDVEPVTAPEAVNTPTFASTQPIELPEEANFKLVSTALKADDDTLPIDVPQPVVIQLDQASEKRKLSEIVTPDTDAESDVDLGLTFNPYSRPNPKPEPLPNGGTLEVKTGIPDSIESISWEEELEKEPEEIFYDFLQAMKTLAAPREESDKEPISAVEDAIFTIAYSEENDALQQGLEVPAIVMTVTEQFLELTEADKEVAKPLVEDIIASVQIITTLELSQATAEDIEAARQELRERVAVLFEELGIEYDEHDVQLFTNMLLLPDFVPPQSEEQLPEEVDLEHDGTHEGKYSFAQIVAAIADEVERDIQQFLGKFALFHFNRSEMS